MSASSVSGALGLDNQSSCRSGRSSIFVCIIVMITRLFRAVIECKIRLSSTTNFSRVTLLLTGGAGFLSLVVELAFDVSRYRIVTY